TDGALNAATTTPTNKGDPPCCWMNSGRMGVSSDEWAAPRNAAVQMRRNARVRTRGRAGTAGGAFSLSTAVSATSPPCAALAASDHAGKHRSSFPGSHWRHILRYDLAAILSELGATQRCATSPGRSGARGQSPDLESPRGTRRA